MAESPTIEKPEAPAAAPAVETPVATQPDSDVSALVEELKKMNVKSPEDLRNKDLASRQAGRLAQELGEVRKANQQLLQMVQELKVSRPAQADPYNANQGEQIDLGKLIEEKSMTAVERAMSKMQQRQIEAQRAVQAEMAKIKNHRRYKLVEPVFQQHLAREDVQAALMGGETTLVEEFDRVRTEMEDQMFEKVTGVLAKTPKPQPPHIEQGDERSIPTPPATEEYKKKLRQIDEDRSKGRLSSDSALDAIIKSVLG